MSLNLYKASNQWATRPADERFSSLEDMYIACKQYANSAFTSETPFHALRVEANKDRLNLVTKMDAPALLTHHAFGQLCETVKAPAAHYREMPATLAAQCLNHFLSTRRSNVNNASVLYHRNGLTVARAITSTVYSRIWNYEVIERCIELKYSQGWRVPPARPAHEGQPFTRIATEADVIESSSIQVGDTIAPAGLYASDHDCFIVLVNPNVRIDDGSGEGLSRGIMISNGEVGDKSLWKLEFDYRHICGNHIFWNVTNISEISVKHVGGVRGAFQLWEADLKTYLDGGANEREAQIKKAIRLTFGATKEQVLDAVFKTIKTGLSKTDIGNAVERAEMYADIDRVSPYSYYGVVQGLTRLAQDTPYMDKRVALERASGSILRLTA